MVGAGIRCRAGWLVAFVMVAAAAATPVSAGAIPEAPGSGAGVAGRDAASAAAPRLASGLHVLGTLRATAGAAADGLVRQRGGDVDVRTSRVAGRTAWTTGDGAAIGSDPIPDHYLAFAASAGRLPRVHYRALIEVSYLDHGTDSLSLQYDGRSGPFTYGGSVTKANSGAWRTADFLVCDPRFARRANGADFRIGDNGDGAESVSGVHVRLASPPGSGGYSADAFGANPYDSRPDSVAIQRMLDTAVCSGDKVVFTSGSVGVKGYRGYQVDRTLFLTGMTAKHDLTFTASRAPVRAVFTATPNLKGFVIRSFARSRVANPGNIDRLTLDSLDVSGLRSQRRCSGADGISNGIGDNWGSWLPGEIAGSLPGDPWALPGTIGLDGSMDTRDPSQAYTAHPDDWTTGWVIRNVVSRETECGSALALNGAKVLVTGLTVIDAGDHVHEAGCAHVDPDGDEGGWSDGITTFGPDITIQNTRIVNPSDLGIAFFGGQRLHVLNTTIALTAGNHGAFGAIGLHGQFYGDVSGSEIAHVTVTSAASTTCGGFHAGIDIGPFMWSGGCWAVNYSQVGTPGPCAPSTTPPPDPKGKICGEAASCTQWIWAADGAPLSIHDNTVTGAHVDYVVGGMSGSLVFASNVAGTPAWTDWHAARYGCPAAGGLTWGPTERAAFAPSLPGWTDLPILCER